MSLVVLDTHVWLWWEANPEHLSVPAAAAIEGADRVAVCTISCWEIGLLAARGRIVLDRPAAGWVRQALAREHVEGLPLTASAAVEAASLPYDRFPSDPADRFIYATARLAGARLVTRDGRIRGYDPALTVW